MIDASEAHALADTHRSRQVTDWVWDRIREAAGQGHYQCRISVAGCTPETQVALAKRLQAGGFTVLPATNRPAEIDLTW